MYYTCTRKIKRPIQSGERGGSVYFYFAFLLVSQRIRMFGERNSIIIVSVTKLAKNSVLFLYAFMRLA